MALPKEKPIKTEATNGAHADAEGQDVVHLSARDAALVVQTLRHPPKPNELLKRVMREHRHDG